jgi:hypothetical protein
MDAAMVVKVWEDGAAGRLKMERIKSYVEGRQVIPELLQRRIDGRAKTRIITNWTKYAATTHTGFMLSQPVSYSPTNGNGTEGLAELRAIYDRNRLNAVDLDHFRNAFLYGFSVEAIGYDGEAFRVVDSWPWNWMFVRDEIGEIQVAIHRVVLR